MDVSSRVIWGGMRNDRLKDWAVTLETFCDSLACFFSQHL